MLDGEVADAVAVVWGHTVPALPCGRRKWPEAVRAMAVEKIAAGAGVRKIAAEIGANKSLVAKWVKNAGSADPTPDFIEALPPTAVKAKPRPESATPVKGNAAICHITLGDADIAISPGYPGNHLIEVLRAVRASQ